MPALAKPAYVYKDKECTQPISLSEMDEMFTSRPLILYTEDADDNGNTLKRYFSVTGITHVYQNGVEYANIAVSAISGWLFYTSEYTIS